MATCTVTLTSHDINDSPVEGDVFVFKLIQWGGSTATPIRAKRRIKSDPTDASGESSIDLWVNGDSEKTSIYKVLLPSGESGKFVIPTGETNITLTDLLLNHSPDAVDPQASDRLTLKADKDASNITPTLAAIWRAALELGVGEDVQAWSTNLDEVADKMSWNNQDLTFDIETGSNGVVTQVGQELLLYCRNRSGVELVDGDVVKINGATGGRPNIEKAIADNVVDARSTIGVVTQTISINSFGFIAIEGKVRGLSLPNGSFDEGDVLYLSDTTPGAFTKTEPDISVEIGHVVRIGNNNGELLVAIQNEASLYELKQLVGKLAGNNIWTGTNTFLGTDFTVQNESYVDGTQTLSFTEVDGFRLETEAGQPTSIGSYGIQTPFLSVDYTDGEKISPMVGEIQTLITPNDTKLCTSGAVVRFAAKHHPVTTFTGTNYETGSTYTETLNALPSFAIEAVRIGSEVTTLSNTLFQSNISIKYVDTGALPTIGQNAFRDCTALERVDIGYSNVIGQSTFRDCTALTEIDLGAVRSINSTCFDGCISLQEITIPQTVTTMTNYIFRGCTSLSLINCYISFTKFNGTDVLLNTANNLVIHAMANDNTWTAGPGQSIAGNTSVEVIKDLY